jgi:hypothetical protein
MMNILFVLLFSEIKLTISVISSEIESFYFFALMQKSNKKNQSAAADEILIISLKSIRRGGGRVNYFKGGAGSNSLDFLTSDN